MPFPPPPHILHAWYIYLGWVGVGWQQRCKTFLSLRELDNQGTVFFFFLGGGAFTTTGGRGKALLCGETLSSAQGGWSYHVVCTRYMVRHSRGSYILTVENPLLSLELTTPENHHIFDAVRCTQENQPRKWFLVGCSSPFMNSPNTLLRFALGASNVCLVGENPTCSVPAL